MCITRHMQMRRGSSKIKPRTPNLSVRHCVLSSVIGLLIMQRLRSPPSQQQKGGHPVRSIASHMERRQMRNHQMGSFFYSCWGLCLMRIWIFPSLEGDATASAVNFPNQRYLHLRCGRRGGCCFANVCSWGIQLFTATELTSLDSTLKQKKWGTKRRACYAGVMHLLQISRASFVSQLAHLDVMLRLFGGVAVFVDEHMLRNVLLNSLT